MEPLLKNLDTLKEMREELLKEGDVLIGCSICTSKPGGTASQGAAPQHHLRSRQAIFNGKKSRYLNTQELAEAKDAIARGKQLKQLDKEIAVLTKKLDRIAAIA